MKKALSVLISGLLAAALLVMALPLAMELPMAAGLPLAGLPFCSPALAEDVAVTNGAAITDSTVIPNGAAVTDSTVMASGAAIANSAAPDGTAVTDSAPVTSWGSINQPVSRAENWQSFVTSSPFVLGAGTPAPDNPAITLRQWGSYPSIDGSTVCVPMGMELARQLLSMTEDDLAGFVAFATTHTAYERLIGSQPNPTVTIRSENAMMDPSHPVDLLLATEPSDEELALAKAAGVTLVTVPFCYDAFVFLVNGKNPVNNMSLNDIRGAYTGKVRNWAEVGGEDAVLIPFQRPKNSGSQTAMENLVMDGLPLSGAVANYISDGMGDLVQAIGNYDNGVKSLGYSFLYYVDVLYKSGDIKTISVDGVAPTAENIRSGAYPFSTCYYAVYRQGDEQTAAFVEWLVGAVGQRCVAQAGYIPILAP